MEDGCDIRVDHRRIVKYLFARVDCTKELIGWGTSACVRAGVRLLQYSFQHQYPNRVARVTVELPAKMF